MNEKKLDQILQQALTPEVNDNEIKVRFEKGEYPMKKKRKSEQIIIKFGVTSMNLLLLLLMKNS